MRGEGWGGWWGGADRVNLCLTHPDSVIWRASEGGAIDSSLSLEALPKPCHQKVKKGLYARSCLVHWKYSNTSVTRISSQHVPTDLQQRPQNGLHIGVACHHSTCFPPNASSPPSLYNPQLLASWEPSFPPPPANYYHPSLPLHLATEVFN